MKILVRSRYEVERDNSIKEPHLIISIRSPGESVPSVQTNKFTVDVKYLAFDDLDRHPERRTGNSPPILFDHFKAESIARFICGVPVSTILVHCAAGISRSAGVGAALAKWFNGDDREFFGGRLPREYRPNMLVYQKMLEALHDIRPLDLSKVVANES